MYFEQILEEYEIDPWKVVAVRHSLKQKGKGAKLDQMLPSLIRREPELFNAVQRWQFNKRDEDKFLKAKYVASFLGNEKYLAGDNKRAIFVGLYEIGAHTKLTKKEVSNHPDIRKLVELGAEELAFILPRESVLRFNLSRIPKISDKYEGKLIVAWSSPIAFTQFVRTKQDPSKKFPIDVIAPSNSFDEQMPLWDELDLSWNDLKLIPETWKDRLKDWKGIYLITDDIDGKSYVGSAAGQGGLHQRWMNYKKTGDGGNTGLSGKDPNNFRFTILEQLPHSMDDQKIIDREVSWKLRLHTRKHGMNKN